jgi:bifunctional non-homologous end joining protein LigD
MAAQAVEVLPQGTEWLYELKLDGYRALVLKDGATVRILSRNEKDLTRTYPTVAAAAQRLKAEQVMLDGEIVALGADGRPSFQALQHRGHRPTIVFYAFDVLYLEGADLTGEPLHRRRALLPNVIGESGLLISAELPGTAVEVVAAVRALNLEGVLAKRRDSIYEPGERSDAWQKLKLDRQQEFVIGGFRTDASSVDALLVGYYEGRALHFAGKVRAGFVPHVRRDLFGKLKPLELSKCPFVDLPSGKSRWGGGVTAEEMHEMRWVKPELVVQIRFVEWTEDGRLRHSQYLGLRADKSAKDVHREG